MFKIKKVSTKFFLFSSIAVMLSTAVAIFSNTNLFLKALYSLEIKVIKNDVVINASPFEQGIGKLNSDVRFLSSLPEIKRLLNQNSKVDKKSLENTFRSVLKANPDYFQIRLINNNETGKELIRVERSGKEVLIIPEIDTQEKGSEGYFQNTIRKKHGEIFVSRVSLNREKGKIQIPYVPVIRAGIPIYLDHKRISAILVINMDVSKRLKLLRERIKDYRDLFLTNEFGQYILHPDRSKEFGFSFGKKDNLFVDYPFLKKLDTDKYIINKNRIFIKHKLNLNLPGLQNQYFLTESIELNIALKELFLAQRNIWYINISFVLVILLLMAFFSNRMFKRLENIYKFSKDYLLSKRINEELLDLKGEDEISALSNSLKNMANDILTQKKEALNLKNKADKANRVKSAFLANMSHEFRTPLNSIQNFSQTLASDLTGNQKEQAEMILKSSSHLLRLVNEILDVSEVDKERVVLNLEKSSLREPINEVYQNYFHTIEDKGIKFDLSFDSDLDRIYKFDPDKLKRILANILKFSMFETLIGTINIQVELISIDRDRGYHNISILVSDTGKHIEYNVLNRIFKKEENDEENENDDSFLGLKISRRICKIMGGDLKISSLEGIGTKYLVTIPLIPVEFIKNQGSLLEEGTDPSKLRILLVDDNEINQAVIITLLDEIKIPYKTALNGQEALDILLNEKESFEIILMDINMPVMNGIKTTKIIRENYGDNHYIIGITANSFSDNIDEIIKAGANKCMAKPLDKEELLMHIAQVKNKKFDQAS